MNDDNQRNSRSQAELKALRTIMEGTAAETGQGFFQLLVRNLAEVLGTYGAWVTEYLPQTDHLRARAFWLGDGYVQDYLHHVAGTPCERVIRTGQTVHFPDRIIELFPNDPDLVRTNAVSYRGEPLTDENGSILGHLAVLDNKPLADDERVATLFRIFAARASAELRRMRAVEQLEASEAKFRRLVESAMDAIIEFDQDFTVTHCNQAAMRLFGCEDHCEQPLSRFLESKSYERLLTLVQGLGQLPDSEQRLWITEGLTGRRRDGAEFPAEATLSRLAGAGNAHHTLILRNVQDRLAAERTIRQLASEAEDLRRELGLLNSEMLGHSPAIAAVLRDAAQVAVTDTTVLILGETGTGKEVLARTIHAHSLRQEMPFIKVNCAAIPAALIESEFFGHERGAFTGATAKRIGRFELADGGTLFLDEVGELPYDLQAKLLRVLQEGEFEPVGSSRTIKINVRIIAATNRVLPQMIKAGAFREDLFYRLNVFPIHLPPLRVRGDDVILLAQTFLAQQARRIGRSLGPLSDEIVCRLRAYEWPGNIRELQNVIERAAITSPPDRFSLDRALPLIETTPTPTAPAPPVDSPRVLTRAELEQLERENIMKALQASGGKIAGKRGAAELLGLKPSTLSSRLKALGIVASS